ncbi:MAG: hypothetical protein KUG53_03995 [Pseudomonadales bacterium]|nr:hypothetical protein [Pseudomonadales bacterium]
MKRYLIEICETRITPITVQADSPQEAAEAVLGGKSDVEDHISQEPFVTRIIVLA